ncbi:uncharacterized protein Schip1 [Palaemon carinicauda]|uniref:uncharacterized protein Schip1 n=1 Tax=Palaemon carinicauda TaxID=392227 RepID=UPI0035B6702F
MHLKETNVKNGSVCVLSQSSNAHSLPVKSASNLVNNNNIDVVVNNNNNNNNNNNITTTVGKDCQPLLIIDKASSAEKSSIVARGGNACLLVGEDGMNDPSPTSSLHDLSEAVSCSSDRIHHPSISSGGQLRHLRSSSNCSLSSIDNDESDLESYSSLEVDISKGDVHDFRVIKDKDSKSLLDFDVLGYRSRRPSLSSCGFQDTEGWPVDSSACLPANIHCNDLSPDHCLNNNNNNVNELNERGAFVKSFYNKPKLQLITDVNNKLGDDNGNLAVAGDCPDTTQVCNNQALPPYESADASSDDENPSDIEQKMAETKVKMNDAILSNGKEDIALHGRKLKQYMKHKELKETCGAASSMKLSNMKQPNSLKLTDTNDGDNRYTQVPESPIVDAYEKECLDVPEKMVRELENQAKENVADEQGSGDEFIPCKKEKMEINEHKKCHTGDGENEGPATPGQGPQAVEKRPEEAANKENSVPVPSETVERPKPTRVTFGGVEELVVRRRDSPQRRRDRAALRKSVPQAASSCLSVRDRAKLGSPDGGEFDVYTMETAMPKIDWDAIEAHLKATKEEERRRRNDREEIRRKLAMGVDDDQFMERPHRKPSLHSRLQSGMNLQICFMNETASDCESQCSDTESTQDREVETDRVSTTSVNSKSSTPQPTRTRAAQSETDRDAPVDFFARQAQLQAEARMALAQAKEMARMQMEIEKQSKNKSPISEIVRESFNKIGVPFPDSKRRISRQILTDMNVAQLQVIVNDLHTQIESLNEELVTYLMERDDLHMEQDSMLVDIEDLTKHIGAKELSLREPIEGQEPPKITPLSTLSTPPSRSKSNSRLKSIVKK